MNSSYSVKTWLSWSLWVSALMAGSAASYVSSGSEPFHVSVKADRPDLDGGEAVVTFALDHGRRTPRALTVNYRVVGDLKAGEHFLIDPAEPPTKVVIKPGGTEARLRLRKVAGPKLKEGQKTSPGLAALQVEALEGNGYALKAGESSVPINVRFLKVESIDLTRPALRLRSSNDKGFSADVNTITVTFELSPTVDFPVSVPLQVPSAGKARRGEDYQINGLDYGNTVIFKPNETTRSIDLRRLAGAARGRGDREIEISYETREVVPAVGSPTVLHIPLPDPKARLSWSLSRSTLPSATEGIAVLTLSISPERDEDVTLRYKILPADPGPPFHVPAAGPDGNRTIRLGRGQITGSRNITVDGIDLVGAPARTLEIEPGETNPPDLRDSKLEKLTLTVADEPTLRGSALVVVVLTKSLADDPESDTMSELKAVERGLGSRLVGESMYALQGDDKLHRWSPRTRPFAGRVPYGDDTKFEQILIRLEAAIRDQVKPRLAGPGVKSVVVWHDFTERKAVEADEKDIKAVREFDKLFWVGPGSAEKGLALQLKNRVKDRYVEYPVAGNGVLSSGILHVLKAAP